MQSVTAPGSTSELREACLETLGYVCQDINASVGFHWILFYSPTNSHREGWYMVWLRVLRISRTTWAMDSLNRIWICSVWISDLQVLESQSNQILTAIVHGMGKQEPSDHVRLAATNALLNSLEFTRRNFENEVVTWTSNEEDPSIVSSFNEYLAFAGKRRMMHLVSQY